MALGVDTNPRFLLFSLILGGIFAYILQNLGILLNLTVNSPLIGFIVLLLLFAFISNIIYTVAVYEVNEDENTMKVYIVITIALALAAVFLYFVGPVIVSILK